MTDDFATRVRTLIAENRRICGFGCNLREYDRETRTYVPKKRDGWRGVDDVEISDAQIERFRKLCAFITDRFGPVPKGRGGWLRVGSYGLKHLIERANWTDDNNRYVSNGEGIVAMMLCGYKPYWSDDESNPNCQFSVRAKYYKEVIIEGQQPRRPTSSAVPS
jgi:hypothetical protein